MLFKLALTTVLTYKEEEEFMDDYDLWMRYGAEVFLLKLEEIYNLQFHNIDKLKIYNNSHDDFGSRCSTDEFDSEKCKTRKTFLGTEK